MEWRQNAKVFFMTYKGKWIKYGIVCTVFLALIGLINAKAGVGVRCTQALISNLRMRNYSEDNLYAAQISASFIMVTMISLLTGNGEDVLWKNTVRYSLVNPKVFNFISISVALIVNLIFSSFAFWLNFESLFIVYFLTDIILLDIMTYRMIGAFFARESIKAQLERLYEKMDKEGKNSVLKTIRDKSFHYIDKAQIRLLDENISFLYKNDEKDTLIEVLEYLSKYNEELFWSYVEKYQLYDDSKIIEILQDVCIKLIGSRQSYKLISEIIETLYGETGKILRMEDVEGYTAKLTGTAEKNVNTQLQNFLEEKKIIPWNIIAVAFNNNDYELFEILLEFLISFKKKLTEIVKINFENEICSNINFVSDKYAELLQNMLMNDSILLTNSNEQKIGELIK